MDRRLRVPLPFFEVGPKNYLFGNDILDLAKAADEIAGKYDVAVFFTAPYVNIPEVARIARHIRVCAPHMDCAPVGRGLANVLPESIRAAGATGVMLNHAEKPLTMSVLRETLRRAGELDLTTLVCADSVVEARAAAVLGSDIVLCEPTELIGSGKYAGVGYVREAFDAIVSVNPNVGVMVSGGIGNGQNVYDVIAAGADGTGSSSGIVLARDPVAMMDEMIRAVREAWNDTRTAD